MKKYFFVSLALLFGGGCVEAQEADLPTPQWRPVYHFTPEKNWTNDPNGLIYLNGKYVLYNQQNPFENKWGHMSWGHAVSTDLIHWKHLPVAIPEQIDAAKGDTTWIFSGSAVWDGHNSSGFCKNGGCLVAIYTAHQPDLKKESQYIAYSNDGGMSFTNYANNPVIDLQKRDFRDPNVFWHAGSGKWVMVVSLPAEHKVRFYGSHNLKQWDLLSEFGPEGYVGANWECPSLLELPVDGSPGVRKWVLLNSAAGGVRGVYMQYFVGDFDGTRFKNDNAADKVLTVDEGDCFYAAIPWNDAPDNDKILLGWMVPERQQTYPWRGQMSIPRDLSLRKTAMGYRLLQAPAAVVTRQVMQLPAGQGMSKMDMAVDNTELALDAGTDKGQDRSGNSYWLDAEWDLSAGTTAGFKIAQSKDADGHTMTETVIGYDPVARQVFVDKTNCCKGSGKGSVNPEKVRQTMEVADNGGKIRLQVLFDKSSLEVFVNGGEQVLTTYLYPDDGATGLSAFASGGKAVIRKMQYWNLSNLRENEQDGMRVTALL